MKILYNEQHSLLEKFSWTTCRMKSSVLTQVKTSKCAWFKGNSKILHFLNSFFQEAIFYQLGFDFSYFSSFHGIVGIMYK